MKLKRQRPRPAAKAQFQAELPGVGVCDKCGQPGTRRHRCRPAKEAKR